MTTNWRRRGACATLQFEPDLWFAPDLETKCLARHICLNHCPVLLDCLEDAKTYPYKGVVAGGIIWSESNGTPVSRGRGLAKICSVCYEEIKEHYGRLHSGIHRQAR